MTFDITRAFERMVDRIIAAWNRPGQAESLQRIESGVESLLNITSTGLNIMAKSIAELRQLGADQHTEIVTALDQELSEINSTFDKLKEAITVGTQAEAMAAAEEMNMRHTGLLSAIRSMHTPEADPEEPIEGEGV